MLLSIVQLFHATFCYHLKRIEKPYGHQAIKEEITAICSDLGVKAKLKGLPPEIHRRQALSVA